MSDSILVVSDVYPANINISLQSLAKLGFRLYSKPTTNKLRPFFGNRRTLEGITSRFGPNQSISLLANKSGFGNRSSTEKLFCNLGSYGHRLALVYQASGYHGSPHILELAKKFNCFLGNCPDITTQRLAINVMPLMYEMLSGRSGEDNSAVQYYRNSDYLERWENHWTAGIPDQTLSTILEKELPSDCFDGKTFFIIGSLRARTFGSHLAKRIEALGGTVMFFSVWGEHKAIMRRSLFNLLPTADAVLLATQLTDDTKGLVNSHFLSKMKDGAILASLARGPMVVEQDLLTFADKLRFIIDVANIEPLKLNSRNIFNELLKLSPESVVTAHSLHLS